MMINCGYDMIYHNAYKDIYLICLIMCVPSWISNEVFFSFVGCNRKWKKKYLMFNSLAYIRMYVCIWCWLWNFFVIKFMSRKYFFFFVFTQIYDFSFCNLFRNKTINLCWDFFTFNLGKEICEGCLLYFGIWQP